MPKHALCLTGNIGTTEKYVGGELYLDPAISWYHFKKYVIDVNDIDVFIHTWHTPYDKYLINLYKPVSYQIDDYPKNFIDKLTQSELERYNNHIKDTNLYMVQQFKTQIYKLLSIKYVISLLEKYSNHNKIIYDKIIISRFDLCYYYKINLNNLKNSLTLNKYIRELHISNTPENAKKFTYNKINTYNIDSTYKYKKIDDHHIIITYNNISKFKNIKISGNTMHQTFFTFLYNNKLLNDVNFVNSYYYDFDIVRRVYYNYNKYLCHYTCNYLNKLIYINYKRKLLTNNIKYIKDIQNINKIYFELKEQTHNNMICIKYDDLIHTKYIPDDIHKYIDMIDLTNVKRNNKQLIIIKNVINKYYKINAMIFYKVHNKIINKIKMIFDDNIKLRIIS